MTPRTLFPALFLLIGITGFCAGCQILSPEKSMKTTHPEKLSPGRPICSECHDADMKGLLKPYQVIDHTPLFVRDHKAAAAREEMVCYVCHAQAFCTDCHTNKREIKPSTKLGDRPDRELVHRGDYMTRHKVEGKIDPVSCYRCHGRSNNGLCQACHK